MVLIFGASVYTPLETYVLHLPSYMETKSTSSEMTLRRLEQAFVRNLIGLDLPLVNLRKTAMHVLIQTQQVCISFTRQNIDS